MDRATLTGATPVRGTQSFVDVMGQVWRKPSLTAIELCWRAVAFVPSAFVIASLHITVNPNPAPPSAEQALALLTSLDTKIASLLTPASLLACFALSFFWILVATAGRAFVLCRLAPQLRIRYGALCLMGFLRYAVAATVLLLWVYVCAFAFNHFVWLPLAAGQDANIVGGFALVVISALLLFIAWCCIGWLFQAAPIFLMDNSGMGALSALKAAWRSTKLRSKLVEINMVMGIVKSCLVVLAMVFSASPLPFSTVETQAFLTEWWIGVFVLWVLASNYFHVVRAAAYLRLYEAFEK